MHPYPANLQGWSVNWDDLRLFVAAARNSTLSAAARQLNMDATTVGRRMERLARSLDARLFETGSAGHVLTEQGRALLVQAEQAETAIAAARGTVTGERTQLAGTVRVSVSEGLGTWLIARHLSEFLDMHPAIRVELVSTNGFLNPSKREADLAIMLARPARGPLIVRKLADYGFQLYAAHSYAAAHGLPKHRSELNQHRLIGYIPDFIYADALRYLAEIDVTLEPGFTSSSINAQHSATRAGLGLCILPRFIGAQDDSLVPVLADTISISRTFWMVVHKDVRRLARVSAFIDWLFQLVRAQGHLL